MEFLDKMIDRAFGNRLKLLRELRGLTQPITADSVGISYSALQKNEGGKWPSQKNLQKYFDFYKCDEVWLKTGYGVPYPDNNKSPEPTPIYKTEEFTDQMATPKKQFDLHGGWKPRPEMLDDDHRMLGFAFQILTSKSIYRNALIANITAFYNALLADQELKKTQKDLKDTKDILKNQAVEIDGLKKKCDELIERIVALEKKGGIDEDVEKS